MKKRVVKASIGFKDYILRFFYSIFSVFSKTMRYKYYLHELNVSKNKKAWFLEQLDFRQKTMKSITGKELKVSKIDKDHLESIEEILQEQNFYYAPLNWEELDDTKKQLLIDIERVLPNKDMEELKMKFPIDGRNDRLVFGAYLKTSEESSILVSTIYIIFRKDYPRGDIYKWFFESEDINKAETALFYSISTSLKFQKFKIGNVGVGTHLIMAAKNYIAETFPQIVNFITYSPLTGLSSFIIHSLKQDELIDTLKFIDWFTLGNNFGFNPKEIDKISTLEEILKGKTLTTEKKILVNKSAMCFCNEEVYYILGTSFSLSGRLSSN